jgi:hypothetical protein
MPENMYIFQKGYATKRGYVLYTENQRGIRRIQRTNFRKNPSLLKRDGWPHHETLTRKSEHDGGPCWQSRWPWPRAK